MPVINILMATFNGANFLEAQLRSIQDQTHTDWRLWISDDGSSDETLEIIQRFKAQHPNRAVNVQGGPRKGSAANFLSMLHRPKIAGGWVAFSDQDDVWMPHKLARAVQLLTECKTPLAIYASRTLHTDAELVVTGESPKFARPFGIGNALVQNVLAGNTIVMPPDMADLLRSAGDAAQHYDVPFHDWWAYLMATGCGAHIINDETPGLYYRQHANNVMGAGLRRRFDRLRLLKTGEFASWIDKNLSAVHQVEHLLTPEAADVVKTFAQRRKLPTWKRASLRRIGLYRQSRGDDAILRSFARLGYL